jgi:hypothetical protein
VQLRPDAKGETHAAIKAGAAQNQSARFQFTKCDGKSGRDLEPLSMFLLSWIRLLWKTKFFSQFHYAEDLLCGT